MAIKLHNSKRHCTHQNLCKCHSWSCAMLSFALLYEHLMRIIGCYEGTLCFPLPIMLRLLPFSPRDKSNLRIGNRTRPFRHYLQQSDSISLLQERGSDQEQVRLSKKQGKFNMRNKIIKHKRETLTLISLESLNLYYLIKANYVLDIFLLRQNNVNY